jgi:hypothetical protein
MFDEKYATSEVCIIRHEVPKGLDVVDVRGLVVRINASTEDAAVDTFSRASDCGVPLRAEGRGVDDLVCRHHADILLERSSALEERGEQLFGLTLWTDVKTTDNKSELKKEGGTVSARFGMGRRNQG